VPLPPPLLHIVGRGTADGCATAGTQRVVTAAGARQRPSRARGLVVCHAPQAASPATQARGLE
jgi:hypothetical protein